MGWRKLWLGMALLLALGGVGGCKLTLQGSYNPCEHLFFASPLDTDRPPQIPVQQPVVLTVLSELPMQSIEVHIQGASGGEEVLPLAHDPHQSTEDTWAYYATWTPQQPGEYLLRAQGQAADCAAPARSEERHLIVVQAAPIQQGSRPSTPTPPLHLTTPTPRPLASPPSPTPEPMSVVFRAEPSSIPYGQCSTLMWRVEHAQAVRLEGQSVALEGSHQVCPRSSTTYHLQAQDASGQWHTYQTTVAVSAPLPTATSTPDQVAPVAPTPLSPGNPDPHQPARVARDTCPITLRWSAVHDPSGVRYEVRVNRQVAPNAWRTENFPATAETSLTLTESIFCEPTTYNWFVRAIDGAGNASGFSEAYYYTLDDVPPPVPRPIEPGTTDPHHPTLISESQCPPTLRWNPVSDYNGVTYEVTLAKRHFSGEWEAIVVSTLEQTTYTPPQSDWCGYTLYRWAVRARDQLGNTSAWSPWYYYEIPIP